MRSSSETVDRRAAGAGAATGWRTAWVVALAGALALALRIALAFAQVFRPDGVRFQEVDPWYHMRTIESLIRHFPHRFLADPYLLFPWAQVVPTEPVFDYVVATAAWLIGVGHPSPYLVEVVGAVAPALLGAMAVIPVYILMARAFDSDIAVAAAFAVAIAPGTFLDESLLGATDHHVLEALLAFGTLAAVAPLGLHRSWRRVAVAAALLSLYTATWHGGALLVVVVAGWALAESWVPGEHPQRAATAVAAVLGSAALIRVAGWSMARPPAIDLLALASGVAVCAVAIAARAVAARWHLHPVVTATICLGAILLGLELIAVRAPDTLVQFNAIASRLQSMPGSITVVEAEPLLFPGGAFTLAPAFAALGPAAPVAVPALLLLLAGAFRRGNSASRLLAVFAAVAFGATLVRIRFAVYLAPCIAVAAAWAGVMLWRMGRDLDREERDGLVYRGLAAFFLVTLLVYPSVRATASAAQSVVRPSDGWMETLTWLRTHTPEPFGDAGVYDQLYPPLAVNEQYRYPTSAYGVTAWWDYGYWIIRAGRRIPNANPTQQGVEPVARFLLAETPESGRAALRALRSAYVIVDGALPLSHPVPQVTVGKFDAIGSWLGIRGSAYHRVYLERAPDGSDRPIHVFLPRYFRTMLVRLYLFGGRATAASGSIWAIKPDAADRAVPQHITAARPFADYEAAQQFMASEEGRGYLLVSRDAASTCVPLDEVPGVRLVHDSPEVNAALGRPDVRVFEVDRR